MDTIKVIIQLMGGLGLFIYGMKLMGDGLENAAGEGLKTILEKVTSNRIMGVGIGAIVTAVIQSSSATTVMVVGFVNAGLMTLAQAAGVIMGANIGTTITAQLVAFKLDQVAPVFVFVGAALVMFAKAKKKKRNRKYNPWFWYTIYWNGCNEWSNEAISIIANVYRRIISNRG